MTEIVARII